MRPKKPLWTVGSKLFPVHLHEQDRYHEALLDWRLRQVVPHPWGVFHLELDDVALRAGELSVRSLAATLPDGTPILVGGAGGDLLPSRALEGLSGPRQELDVYIGLAQPEGGIPGVDLDGTAAGRARYTRVREAAADLVTGHEGREVDWLRGSLAILFGHEPRERHDTLRIAQLVRSPAGTIVARDTFIPPVVRIGASPFLVSSFRRLLAAMTAKQQSLAQSRRQRSASVVEFQAADAAKFWLLHTLNGALPVVADLVEQPDAHPREAYRVLAQLVGQLSTFDAQANPLDLPKFNYLELGEVFEPLFAKAMGLLDTVIAERFTAIPLTEREGQFFFGELRDAGVLRHDFFLGVVSGGGVTEAHVREYMPRMAKVASQAQIQSIVRSAVSGAVLTVEYRPPAALPARPGTVFFRIDRNNEYWTHILATGAIAVASPFAPGTLQMTLFAVDPATLQ